MVWLLVSRIETTKITVIDKFLITKSDVTQVLQTIWF